MLQWMLGVLLLAVAVPRPGWGLPPAREQWLRVRTPHFTLVSNAKATKIREVGLALEHFRAVLDADLVSDASLPLAPTTILLFKDEASFQPYNLRPDGTPDNSIGRFVATPVGNFILMNAENDAQGTIFHEFVHYIVSTKFLDLPLWLNEGMAEFYSTFWQEENTVEIGRPIENHVLFLRTQPLIPLVELFAMNTESRDYHEGVRQGVFYAESWALYHYFHSDRPDLLPKLRAFLQVLADQPTDLGGFLSQPPGKGSGRHAVVMSEDARTFHAFKTAFGVGYEAIEAELRRLIRNDTFKFHRIEVDGSRVDTAVRVEPMPRVDLLYCLGEYLSRTSVGSAPEAERHFREALTSDPSNARTHAGLACLLERSGHSVDANAEFLQAVDLARDDALPFFLYAMSKIERYTAGHPEVPLHPDSLPAELRAARGLLSRCLDLGPEHGEAYAALGSTYLFDPENTAEGIQILMQARRLMPARLDVVYSLMLLCLRLGDLSAAERLAGLIFLHGKDPDMMLRTRVAIDRARLEEEVARRKKEWTSVHGGLATRESEIDSFNLAVRKYNVRDYIGALAVLERLLPVARDSAVAAEARRMRQDAMRHLTELKEYRKRIQEHGEVVRQVDLYNVAVRKANSGDYAGAAAILERLVPVVKNPELATAVRIALDHVKAMLAEKAAPGP